VNYLEKIKIHELAKKLGVEAKKVVEVAKENGIEAKSHLSSITEEEAKKLERLLKDDSKGGKPEKKKESREVQEKNDNPVIIRRAVIFEEDNKKEQKRDDKPERKEVGFVETRRNKDYNIVYRDKPTKPLTVSELLGIAKKKPAKEPEPEEVKKPEPKADVKPAPAKDSHAQKHEEPRQTPNRNNNNNNNNRRPSNFDKKDNYRKDGNNSPRNNNYNRNNQKSESIDVDIPVEKESSRDFDNRAKDRAKQNRLEEKNNNANKKGNFKSRGNDFSEGKLKDLKRSRNGFSEGDMLDYYDLSNDRRRKQKKNKQEAPKKNKIFKLTEITIPDTITVKNLAAEMKITSSDVIKKLLDLGIMATINNEVDFDTAFLVAQEYGITANKKNIVTDEDILIDDTEDKEEELEPRPPVVVVMGHVDHGKTSLLDAIRNTNVIEGESGGITQHIGAYQVKINARDITFLDTPGHEAFTSMRARGAMITDVAILVVAANDGVMPQTVEAINHAKAAGIPIIVAVNKMDLPDANFDKVQQQLMTYELVPEAWGGNTIYVPISAKKNQGIDNLLEMVLLQADMLELKANYTKQAKGTVIEARLDQKKGSIATMLVQRGRLDVGDTIIVGSSIGRIRTMTNDKGKPVKSAGPSTPVEITGLTSVPQSGEVFYEVKDERTAKHLIEKRKYEQHQKEISANQVVTLDDLFNKIESENLKELDIIVKADVQGSVEALKQSLEKLSNEEVRVKVIHASVGGVSESDVNLAKVSGAIVIAFNVRPDPIAKSTADNDGIEIKQYSVIYDAINDVEAAMKGMLDPIYKEVVIGTAEVRQTFKISSVGTIAGCFVLTGKVSRNAGIRVIRDNIVIHDGKLISLKRFKDDAKEVDKGYECGLQIENFNDLKEGDQLEVYIMEEVKR
jgi:translation initiation factor IF-2